MTIVIDRYRGKFRLYSAAGDEDEFLILIKKIRKAFSVKNPTARFSDFADDEVSCISPMGAFSAGLTMDVIRKIKSIDPTVKIDTSRVISDVVPFSHKGMVEGPENDAFILQEGLIDAEEL